MCILNMWHDVRIACRSLLKQPVFSLMTVVVLAIGIGGATAVFGLFNGLFLNPFPVPNQDRLMELHETAPQAGREHAGVSYAPFHAWREHGRTFEHMGFCSFWAAALPLNDSVERVSIRLATHDYIDVLGLRPVLGRSFTAEEDRPGGPNVVLLSHGLWERLFARDPAVLGRTLRLDNDLFTVIGVLPPEADFPETKDLWQPLRADPVDGHGGMGTMAVGLLKEGVSIEQAREDLTHVHQGWLREHPEREPATLPVVTTFRELFRREVRQFQVGTSILLVVTGFVLLVACCNVMSIMLARGTNRSKEMAMCAALGATRARIIAQVLAESLLLSAVGGALGVLLGWRALGLLLAQLADVIPSWMTFEPDLRSAAFCVFLVCVATVLSGLVPASYAAFAGNLHSVLQTMGARATISASRRRTLNTVVVVEVSLALTLLVGAGLLMRSFRQVQDVDPGFRAAGVLTYNISLPIGPYYDENKRRAFWEEHLERIRTLPGVTHAALSNYLPMAWPSFEEFEVEGASPANPGQSYPSVLRQKVTPGYFETLGVTVLVGRAFREQDDRKGAERVAIVNEMFVRRFWPGADPIDKRIRAQGSQDWVRVVGVVKDAINSGLDRSAWPAVYLPPVWDVSFGMFGVVRTAGDPLALMPSIRGIVRSADPEVPVESVRTMSQRIDESLWLRRLAAWLFAIPAAAAAIMAFAGIYGIVSYSTSRRIQEIGIRMAMGATTSEIVSMVIRQGARLILAGLAFGVVGGFVLSRLFTSIPGMLYNVSPTDPATFIVVVVLLAATALTACYLPARRAARIDPMEALRYE